jgi:hypothetical protein
VVWAAYGIILKGRLDLDNMNDYYHRPFRVLYLCTSTKEPSIASTCHPSAPWPAALTGDVGNNVPRASSRRRMSRIFDRLLTVRLHSSRRQESDFFLGEANRKSAACHSHTRSFGFDMSPQNFTIRKSTRTSHKFLYPILASISASDRSSALSVPKHCVA